MTRLTLGLGSNMGDRMAMLRAAVAALVAEGIIMQAQCSRVYESAALLPEGAPVAWDQPFLNMVVAGETWLAPEVILQKTQAIEQALGRQRRGHWGPREIDIDLLLLGDVTCRSPTLTLPHPHMDQRAFVLWPLADIFPEWGHKAAALPRLPCVGDLL